MKQKKYRNKFIYANLGNLTYSLIKHDMFPVKFDSVFEFNVYQLLRKYFDVDSIKRQTHVLIKPHSGNCHSVSIKFDFSIHLPNNECFKLIEAKGYLTQESKLKLNFLEYLQPHIFTKILFVSNNKVNLPYSINAISFFKFEETLKQLRSDYNGLVLQQKGK